MNKIRLIIEREYVSRVKKKTFLIMTLVGPLLFAGLIIIPAWLAMREKSENRVYVLDNSGQFGAKLKSNAETKFVVFNESEEKGRTLIKEQDDHHLLLIIGEIQADGLPVVRILGQSNPSLDLLQSIENQINAEIKNQQLLKSGIDPGLVARIKPDIDIQTLVLSEEGEKEGSSTAATVIGFGSGFLIYIFIFLYGSQVMTGVMEEKTSRVVEVLISSVRPFELMLGKIVGVALVGLTQFLLWLVLSYAIMGAVGSVVELPSQKNAPTELVQDPAMQEQVNKKMKRIGLFRELGNLPVASIVFYFLFYFLGGYLLYSALFAAVGAAVDNQQDAQQFMFPITIPIIAAIALAQFVIKDPNSNLAFWLSVIPFTSPIIMMIRIPFEPPFWQILLSMLSLVAGFFATTWLAGKIYRVGILMYGKKVTYLELWKWIRYKS
jgi:ABC-2 type transport system permease protein